MTLAQLATFNAVLLAAIASPGPAMLVALRTTLAEGPRAGLATGAGLGVVAAGWTAAALLGLDALFRLVPWAYAAMKTAGALYLLHVAYATWRHAAQPVEAAPRRAGNALLRGALINLLNPKSVLFAGAVIVVVFPAGIGAAGGMLIALNHLAVELTFYALLAFAISRPAVSRRYIAAKRWLDRIAALLLGALGLRLLTGQAGGAASDQSVG